MLCLTCVLPGAAVSAAGSAAGQTSRLNIALPVLSRRPRSEITIDMQKLVQGAFDYVNPPPPPPPTVHITFFGCWCCVSYVQAYSNHAWQRDSLCCCNRRSLDQNTACMHKQKSKGGRKGGGEGGVTSCSLVRPVHGPHSFLNLVIGPHAHQALTEDHASACNVTSPEPRSNQAKLNMKQSHSQCMRYITYRASGSSALQ